MSKGKHERFHWLEPPEMGKMITIGNIVNGATPSARCEQLQAYVQSVWNAWSDVHGTTLANWYTQYVA